LCNAEADPTTSTTTTSTTATRTTTTTKVQFRIALFSLDAPKECTQRRATLVAAELLFALHRRGVAMRVLDDFGPTICTGDADDSIDVSIAVSNDLIAKALITWVEEGVAGAVLGLGLPGGGGGALMYF
jgi:hypothetical protein